MATSAQSRLHQLVRGLIAATASRRISWQETDREHAYQYVSGDTSLIVGTSDNDGVAPFELQLLDSHGSEIEALKSSWYSEGGEWASGAAAPWSDDLRELHRHARNSAKQVDAIVDRLLAEFPPDDQSSHGGNRFSYPSPREDLSNLEIGEFVTHDKYGTGVVTALDGEGRRRTVTIDFGASGTVRLMLIGGVPLRRA